MKNESLKMNEVQELPKESNLMNEVLDFSDLINVKGGRKKDETKDDTAASGHNFGFGCGCK